MRSLIHYLVVITFCGGAFFLTGCATRLSPDEFRVNAEGSEYDPSLLKHQFCGYEAALRFLAAREGLPQDTRSLFEIAADSDLERACPPTIGVVVVVRLEYRGVPGFSIRGAQGNGPYYAFRVTGGYWQLVGIFHGNSLRWQLVGNTVRVFVHSHESAFDDLTDDPAYVWNGKYFE